MKVRKTYTRLYVENLETVLPFYETIYATKTQRRFALPHMKIELATIGDVLIVAGHEDALRPLQPIKATFIVDSIDEFFAYFTEQGIRILHGPQEVPTGKNMTVQHADGTIIEYVEPNPA